ncbi:MAG: hypothetical protein SGARI_001042, partial [Bacillariaceae sp.]
MEKGFAKMKIRMDGQDVQMDDQDVQLDGQEVQLDGHHSRMNKIEAAVKKNTKARHRGNLNSSVSVSDRE